MLKKFLLTLCMLVAVAAGADAQCGAVNDAIKPGEKLTYELKFNWKFIWLKVGHAVMKVDTVTRYGMDCLQTDLRSYTNGFADRFFRMRDTLTCITTDDLVPLYFRKGAEEGKKYTVDEIRYSYDDGKCCVKQQRIRNGEPVQCYDEVEDCVYDMLSIMLQARSYDASKYNVGDKILFSMATGKAIEEQTLIYRGKKNFRAENGTTYRCLVFSFVEYEGKGKSKDKEKEVITFFITDDDNHLPVRLDMYLNFGSAKVFLSEIEGNKYPLTSIVGKK